MFGDDIQLSNALLVQIAFINIIALNIANYFSNSEFNFITLLISPIAAILCVYFFNDLLLSQLPMETPWLFDFVAALIIFTIISFVVMGLDPHRHNSDMMSIFFFGIVNSLLLFAILNQFDKLDTISDFILKLLNRVF